MEFAVLGWPPDGPTLRLDWRRFSYAGKFVVSSTGKAVVREGDRSEGEFDDHVLAALAFSPDRTDGTTLWYRYVTVRDDQRGEALGPRLLAFVAPHAANRGYERLRIAVNNAFSYEACYKGGFAFTGRETGLAELVLERPAERPAERSPGRHDKGLTVLAERDLSPEEQAFLDARRDVPPLVPDAEPGQN